jgi:CRP-like cAMP-binding protein
MTQQEDLFKKYMDKNNKEGSIKVIFELLTARAREKNFQEAEALRDLIFEIDPFAFSEIVRSGDIIEEEKSQVINKSHREVWAKLYDDLSVEEANTFYFALENAVYEAGATIFEQGEHKPRLYFINSGRPKLIYSREDVEVFLKLVEPGQLAGQETFLFDTVYTTSMITHSRVELSFLDTSILKRWATEFPVLESKLRSFAMRSENTTELLKAKRLDRRAQKRLKVSGRGIMQLVSSSENPVGEPLTVEMCDISQGGLCFYLRIKKKETTGLLLGQRLTISYLHPPLDSAGSMGQTGIIVAGRFYPFTDSTIRVKFDRAISPKIIDEFQRQAFSRE